jgi:hypothetical protein
MSVLGGVPKGSGEYTDSKKDTDPTKDGLCMGDRLQNNVRMALSCHEREFRGRTMLATPLRVSLNV